MPSYSLVTPSSSLELPGTPALIHHSHLSPRSCITQVIAHFIILFIFLLFPDWIMGIYKLDTRRRTRAPEEALVKRALGVGPPAGSLLQLWPYNLPPIFRFRIFYYYIYVYLNIC